MKDNKDLIIDGDKFKKTGTINQDKVIRKNDFKFYRDGTRWGIAAGVGMALFLVVAQLLNMGDSISLKFFKYIMLIAVLGFGLSVQRNYLQQNYSFKDGILFGAYATFVSAITLALMNIIIFAASDSLAFDKFSVKGNTFGNTILISGVLFFEVLVFGMIATFCCLQFIKPKRKGAEKPV